MDPGPGGPKTCGSGSVTLGKTMPEHTDFTPLICCRRELSHRDDCQRVAVQRDIRGHLQHAQVRGQGQEDQDRPQEERPQCGLPCGAVRQDCRGSEVRLGRGGGEGGQCCGSGMFIPDLGFRIPGPKPATKERGEKKCLPFFEDTNFTKLKIILFLKC
jgi:hypothetical protein